MKLTFEGVVDLSERDRNEDEIETLVQCPACEDCLECERSHEAARKWCEWCQVCTWCGGTHLVTVDHRKAWREERR